LQIRRGVDRHGKPLHLLQRDVPGDNFGDPAHLGLGDPVAVEQRVGRDRDEAHRRQRRDT
jgi:hypothetical protein